LGGGRGTLDALLAMQRRSASDPPVPNAQHEPHWPAKYL